MYLPELMADAWARIFQGCQVKFILKVSRRINEDKRAILKSVRRRQWGDLT